MTKDYEERKRFTEEMIRKEEELGYACDKYGNMTILHSNTPEAGDYIWRKGKEFGKHATTEDVNRALDYILEHCNHIHKDNETMLKFILFGSLLDHANTDNLVKIIGYKAYYAAKYVYRGHETIKEANLAISSLQGYVDELIELAC